MKNTNHTLKAFLSGIAWLLLLDTCSAFGEAPREPPATIAHFDVSRPNANIHSEIKISEHRSYQFHLYVLYNGGEEQAKIQELVGGWGRKKGDSKFGSHGVVIPIHFFISDSSGKVIEDATHYTQGSNIHGFSGAKEGYYARYISSADLKPGLYKIEINTVQATPEFNNVSCAIHIGWRPNTRPIKD